MKRINRRIFLQIDGTVQKNKSGSDIAFSKKILSTEFNSDGSIVPISTKNGIENILRHKFAYHCFTECLATQDESNFGRIPKHWKSPYTKDHANGNNSLNCMRNICTCYFDDNIRAHRLKMNKDAE